MQLQRIAQIIQPDAMAQLGVDQANDMTPRLERARFILCPGGARNFGNEVLRNKIANLAQHVELAAGWNDFELIHPCRVAGANKNFQPFFSTAVGWLWSKYILQQSALLSAY